MSDLKFSKIYAKDAKDPVVFPVKTYTNSNYPYTPILWNGYESSALYPAGALAVVSFHQPSHKTQPYYELTAGVNTHNIYTWPTVFRGAGGSCNLYVGTGISTAHSWNTPNMYQEHIHETSPVYDVDWVHTPGGLKMTGWGDIDSAKGNSMYYAYQDVGKWYLTDDQEECQRNRQFIPVQGLQNMPTEYASALCTAWSDVIDVTIEPSVSSIKSFTGKGNGIIDAGEGAPYGVPYGIYLGYQNNTSVWGTTALRASYGAVFGINKSNSYASFVFNFKGAALKDCLHYCEVKKREKDADGRVLGYMRGVTLRHPGRAYNIKGLGSFQNFALNAGNASAIYGADNTTIKSYLKCLGTVGDKTYLYFQGDHKITSGAGDIVSPLQIFYVGDKTENVNITSTPEEKYYMTDSWIAFKPLDSEYINGGKSEPAFATLRIKFSSSASNPVTSKWPGTWTKIATDTWDVQLVPSGSTTTVLFEYFKNTSLNTGTGEIIAVGDMSLFISFSHMFENCKWLTGSVDWNTAQPTNGDGVEGMFKGCSQLVKAPYINTSYIQVFDDMFYECYELTSVPAYDLSNAVTMKNMFYACLSLEKVKLANVCKNAGTNTYPATCMFKLCSELKEIPDMDYSHFSDMTELFAYTSALTVVTGEFGSSTCTSKGMFDYSGLTSFDGIIHGTGSGYTFKSCANLKTINLTMPDISGWQDTSNNPIDGGSLSFLETFVGNFPKVVTIQCLLKNATALKNCTVNAENARNMDSVCYNCTRLISAIFNVSPTCSDLDYAFTNCKVLESVDITDFNSTSLTLTAYEMFAYTGAKLKTVNWKVNSGNMSGNFSSMFYESGITEIPTGLSIGVNAYNYRCFYSCDSLKNTTPEKLAAFLGNRLPSATGGNYDGFFQSCPYLATAVELYTWMAHNGFGSCSHSDTFTNAGAAVLTEAQRKKIPVSWGGLGTPDFTADRPYTLEELSNTTYFKSVPDITASSIPKVLTFTKRDETTEKTTYYDTSKKSYYYYKIGISTSGTQTVYTYTLALMSIST